jgi:hypothetical protein
VDGTGFAKTPVMTYGVNLLAAALAYLLLQVVIIHFQGKESALHQAVGRDAKGKTSVLLYLTGIACALLSGTATRAATIAAIACYVAGAILWLVPDRRIGHVIDERGIDQQAVMR